jgi:transcriptional regulator with XRE-family HTH domain
MADTVLVDEPQTVELLRSMRLVMRWLSAMPPKTRRQLLGALAECSDEIQGVVFQMVSIVENPRTTSSERQQALTKIADVLRLNADEAVAYGQELEESARNEGAAVAGLGREFQKMDCQEAAFADRLRELMTLKCVTQEDLSNRVGCSQPAISQMLNRKRRPQKKTILRLADALQVQPQELWPDIEVADMLDAAASFAQGEHVMTEAEAQALRNSATRNLPKIPVRPLPTRKR